MRLKGRDYKEVRRWKKIQEALGYLPHYHRVGRIFKEIRFVPHKDDRKWWVVRCVVTNVVMIFRKNGTPLNGSGGRLVGPLIEKRKVKK
jgi:hypothetical protein